MNKRQAYVASRKQLRRMATIISLLKRRNCTMLDIQDELDRASHGEIRLSCSERTVRNDIYILQREYGCPVEYNPSLHRYVLWDKDWSFSVPALMNADELLAVIIGEKFSKDILPPSISKRVEEAVNEILRFNSSNEFIARGRIDSLRLLSNIGSIVKDAIFKSVFDAWRACKKLYIEYNDKDNNQTKRVIEPHALAFYDMQWSIRAKCPDDGNGIRTFHVGRITQAYVLEEEFIPDKAVIDTVKSDNYYMFKERGEVKIRLTQRGAQYARIHLLRPGQTFTMQDKNTFILSVKSVSEEEAIQWIFSHIPGDAIPIAPQWIVDAFKKALDTMKALCPAYPSNNV